VQNKQQYSKTKQNKHLKNPIDLVHMESEPLQDTAHNSWTSKLSDSASLALSKTIQFSSASDVKTAGENMITHAHTQKIKRNNFCTVYLDSFIRHFPSKFTSSPKVKI